MRVMKENCLLLLKENRWSYVFFWWSFLLNSGTLMSSFLMFTDWLWALCFGKYREVLKFVPFAYRHWCYCRGKWCNLRPAWLIIRTEFCTYVSYAMLLKPETSCMRCAKKGASIFLRAEMPRKPLFLLLCVLRLNSHNISLGSHLAAYPSCVIAWFQW